MNNFIEEDKPKDLISDLEYTRELKHRIIDQCLNEDGTLKDIDDPKQRDFFLRVLDSVDKTAIARQRILVDEGANEIARETVGFLNNLHKQNHVDPFRVDKPQPRDIVVDINRDITGEVTEYMLSQEPEAGKTDFTNFREEFLEAHPEYDD